MFCENDLSALHDSLTEEDRMRTGQQCTCFGIETLSSAGSGGGGGSCRVSKQSKCTGATQNNSTKDS